MPTQVQIRGAAQATQETRTLASRELDINTTDDRLSVHDGTTVGGIPHLNFKDAQNQEFTYAAATGTDAIAITLSKAPDAYAAGQSFEFKAANNITGSATLNVNSLGAKTIKKVSSGAVEALAADDIVQDGIYRVTYDGTDFILIGAGGGAAGWEYGSVSLSGTSNVNILTGVSGLTTFEFVGYNLGNSFNIAGGTVLIYQIQIGDSGGFEASGYKGGAISLEDDTSSDYISVSSGLLISTGATSADNGTFSGSVVLVDPTNSTYSMWGNGQTSSTLGNFGISSQCQKRLTTELTQIRFNNTQGTGSMDGEIYYRYKTE